VATIVVVFQKVAQKSQVPSSPKSGDLFVQKIKLEQKSVFKRKNQHRNINNIQKK
jgi:hypothetical protein